MLIAAEAWRELAAGLNAAAAAQNTVVANLTTGPWSGGAAQQMSAAMLPYLAWLSTTAARAEQTAVQLEMAAGAFEAAHAATVPPPLIEANRSLLAMLLATNFLGQNTPAIAATEALYAEMWAQDTAAMYGYAATASTASTLTPFSGPPRTSDGSGVTPQVAAAPAQAAEAAATVTSTPHVLQSLSVPQGLAGLLSGQSGALGESGSAGGVSGLSSAAMAGRMAIMPLSMLMRMLMMGGAQGAARAGAGGAAAAPLAAAGTTAGLPASLTGSVGSAVIPGLSGISGVSGGVPQAAAGLGRAVQIGGLSAPPAWAGAAGAPGVSLVAATGSASGTAGGAPLAAIPPVLPAAGHAAARSAVGGSTADWSLQDTRGPVIPRSPIGG